MESLITVAKEDCDCIRISSQYIWPNSLQNRTLSSSNVPGFIAFTNSFQILKTWIKSSKNSKSKFSCQICGIIPKNEVNPRFHDLFLLLTVGEVKHSLPRLTSDSSKRQNSNLLRWLKIPKILPLKRHQKPLKNLLFPPFVKTNCCAGLDNSPHVYSKRFHLIMLQNFLIWAKFWKFWLKQAFGGWLAQFLGNLTTESQNFQKRLPLGKINFLSHKISVSHVPIVDRHLQIVGFPMVQSDLDLEIGKIVKISLQD